MVEILKTGPKEKIESRGRWLLIGVDGTSDHLNMVETRKSGPKDKVKDGVCALRSLFIFNFFKLQTPMFGDGIATAQVG